MAVAGRFHGFELARELDRAGALAALLTSYPRFAARRDGVAGGRVRCFPVKEIAERLHRRLAEEDIELARPVQNIVLQRTARADNQGEGNRSASSTPD